MNDCDDTTTHLSDSFGIYRGDSWGHTIRIGRYDTDGTTWLPHDLTDYTVTSQMRTRSGPFGALVVNVSATIDPNPATGVIVTNLLPSETEQIVPATVAWDLQLAKDGLVWSPLRVTVPVSGDVTREETP
ncbi:hypothetical protein [Mycobacterium sp.]|uniref:hypothetical protein n=1 Tax=Mycobacterium sp. TaxID=1785 RepID=UPI003A8B8A44